MTLNPMDVVLPIFGVDPDGNIKQFLGTGSFIGSPPVLLTAEHVIRDWPHQLAVSHMNKLNTIFLATVICKDAQHDLALLKIDGYCPLTVLSIDANLAHQNQMLVTFEYGTTRSAGNKIELSPATRMGNITRILNLTDQFNKAGEDILELSFPALRGASGAPVVSNDDNFNLQGVIIANVNYHLLPAQIESILDEKNEVLEETQFMLPQALAVNVKHVRALLERHIASTST